MEEDSIVDATEDDQLEAAIKASLTDVQVSKALPNEDMEIDTDSELETFTDSDDNAQMSPIKTKKSDSISRSQMKSSPKSDRKGKSDSSCQDYSDNETLDRKLLNKACSPSKSHRSSPKPVTKPSSPKRNVWSLCPSTSTAPSKSNSIHNDVHPAVIENVKKTMSEGESKDTEAVDKSGSEECDTSDSPVSVDNSACADTRDYKNYLGNETGIDLSLFLSMSAYMTFCLS